MADYDFGALASPVASSKPSFDFGNLASPVAAPEHKSEGVAQKERMLAAADQAAKENGKLFDGAGEAVLNAVSGIGSSAVGGWKGMLTLAKGGSLDDAAKAIQDTQQKYTYQPRTGVGKLATEALSLPINVAKAGLSSMAGDVGELVNGQQGRVAGESIGSVLPDVAATLMGGRAAMVKAKAGFRGRAPIDEPAPAIQPEQPAVNYDVPAFIRNRNRAAPVLAEETVPVLPVAESAPVPKSALDLYSEQEAASPYGQILPNENVATPAAAPEAVNTSPLDQFIAEHGNSIGKAPELPAVTAQEGLSPLDQHIAEAGKPLLAGEIPAAGEVAGSPLDALIASGKATDDTSPARFDQFIHDTTAPQIAPKSPLDSFIAGEPIPAPKAPDPAAIAGATGDIQAVLKSIAAPEAEPVPLPPQTPPSVPVETIPAQGMTPPLPQDHALRLQILRDVGLDRIRQSALAGDAAKAAQEYQTTKFSSEPAGMAALDQFSAERDALANHTQKLIDRTGAPSGLDEQSMQIKGQAIAAPYDAARGYFEAAKQNLYDIADKRAAASGGAVKTAQIDSLLSDPDFKATMMAKDQQSLMNTIQSQYERFKALGPDGEMTVQNAENFRKWLNKVWTPDNSGTLGMVKAALDHDVFKSAGEDVYAAARQMHQLEKKTLDDPRGISKLMDADPYTPINRTTPYNKIADSVVNLSPDQFQHIIDTYKNLPPELQPLAQKAIATIKAHYGDKLLQAGLETRAGFERPVWNGTGVNKVMLNNSAKLPMVFTDPAEIAALNNLRDAGQILNVQTAYPGAAAQAANALKSGLMSKVIGRAGTVIGGGAGSFAGPVGAGVGAFVGDAISSRFSNHLSERKALEQFKKGIIDAARSDH